MKANLKMRILTYMLDLFIVVLLATILSLFFKSTTVEHSLQLKMAKLSEDFLSNKIGFFTYINNYSILSYDFDKNNMLFYLCEGVIIFIYYQIIPFFIGKTIGCMFFHIKIKDKKHNKVAFSTLLKRNLVVNGIGYFILFVLGMYLFKSNIYLIWVTFLAIIQILVVIISAFMIKYRRDKRSFADIISNSNIVLES